MQFLTKSEKETEDVAKALAKKLKPGDVLLFHGGLGAGKTAFVRGLGEGLGCDEPASSPTYTLIHEYGGEIPLAHFDLYRLGDVDEAEDIGLRDYLYGRGICAIEWPDVAMELMPDKPIHITIAVVGEDEREITIEGVEDFAVSGH